MSEKEDIMYIVDEYNIRETVYELKPDTKPEYVTAIDDVIQAFVNLKAEVTGEETDDLEPLTLYAMAPGFYMGKLNCPSCHEGNQSLTFPLNLGVDMPLGLEDPVNSDFDESVEWQRYTYDLMQGIYMHKGRPDKTIYIPYDYNSEATSIDNMLKDGNHD